MKKYIPFLVTPFLLFALPVFGAPTPAPTPTSTTINYFSNENQDIFNVFLAFLFGFVIIFIIHEWGKRDK